MTVYAGKDLTDYDLWALGMLLQTFKNAEKKREEASKHPKFNKLKLPPINPTFLELKNEVEKEIRKKQGA